MINLVQVEIPMEELPDRLRGIFDLMYPIRFTSEVYGERMDGSYEIRYKNRNLFVKKRWCKPLNTKLAKLLYS